MNALLDAKIRTMSMSRRGLFERLYEVHAGEELCATLSFDSSFGGGATGLFRGDSWTFKRTGFFICRVAIRRATSEFDDAVYENRRWSRRGALALAGGRAYTVSFARWGSGLQMCTAAGETVIDFRPAAAFSERVHIEVTRHSPDLPLLLLLGCYLAAVTMEESTSAAAAVAALG